MRYKVLLVGNNKATIEDMFLHANNILECQSTSSRFDDIVCHLKYFQPHVLVYCMHNETREIMSQLVTIKHTKLERKTPFFLVATQEDSDEMRRLSADFADVSLIKPITALQIADKITEYIKRNLSIREEEPKPAEPVLSAEQTIAYPLSHDRPERCEDDSDAKSKQTILVVDDDFRMLKLIKRYLDDTYDIATAINGKVALKFLETKMTNLILLDYEMPVCDGRMTLEMIRADDDMKDIPVVFLTAVNDRANIEAVLKLKPAGYFLKPAVKDKLLVEIEKILKGEGAD